MSEEFQLRPAGRAGRFTELKVPVGAVVQSKRSHESPSEKVLMLFGLPTFTAPPNVRVIGPPTMSSSFSEAAPSAPGWSENKSRFRLPEVPKLAVPLLIIERSAGAFGAAESVTLSAPLIARTPPALTA